MTTDVGPYADLVERARAVLAENDLGRSTKPSPRLYPHQWSWDSAFIAIGLAHLDPARAALELATLFEAQWANGLVPHIVFNPEAAGYFPDAAYWSSDRSPEAPKAVRTSGLIQPPVHAIAAWRVWELGGDLDALRALYPKLVAWHRCLLTARDPEGSGLVTIFHPWESGTDNSPRWDAALRRVQPRDLPPYQRADLRHVADPAMRPTDAEYDRYISLVEALKSVRYDQAAAYARLPFKVKDLYLSSILHAATVSLRRIAEVLGEPVAELDDWLRRIEAGLASAWDEQADLPFDRDAVSGEPVRVKTCACLGPLLQSTLPPERRRRLGEWLFGPECAGDPRLRYALAPSTSPAEPAFNPLAYWRGPQWINVQWLAHEGLRLGGDAAAARRLRREALRLVAEVGCWEYFQPFDGRPLGGDRFAWTAALAIDLAALEADET